VIEAAEASGNRIITALILACTVYHLAVFAALHALVPPLDPVSSIITDYLDSPYRSLSRSTFAAFGLMWAAVAAGMWRTLPRWRLTVAGVVLMALGVLSLVLVTLRPPIADPRNATEAGMALARVGGIGRTSLFISLVVLSLVVRRQPRSRTVGGVMLGLATAAILLLAITLASLLERGYAGIAQRAIFLVLYTWVLLAALRVIAPHRESDRRGATRAP
jgi:hypothetical protein